jgi:hypothetical protein
MKTLELIWHGSSLNAHPNRPEHLRRIDFFSLLAPHLKMALTPLLCSPKNNFSSENEVKKNFSSKTMFCTTPS